MEPTSEPTFDDVLMERGWRQLKGMGIVDSSIKSNPNLSMVKILSVIEHDMDLNVLAQCLRQGANPNLYVTFDPLYWKERYDFKDKKLHVILFATHTLYVRKVDEDVIRRCVELIIASGGDLDRSAIKLWMTAELSPYNKCGKTDGVTVREVIEDMIDTNTLAIDCRCRHMLEKIDLSSSTYVDLIRNRMNALLSKRLRSVYLKKLTPCDIDFLYTEAIMCHNVGAITVIKNETKRNVPYWLRKPLNSIGFTTTVFTDTDRTRLHNLLRSLKGSCIDTDKNGTGIGNPSMFGKSCDKLVGAVEYTDDNKRWIFPIALHQEAISTRRNPYNGKALPDEFVKMMTRYWNEFNREMIDVRSLLVVEDVDELLQDDEKLLLNRVEWLKHNHSSVRDPDALDRFCRTYVSIPTEHFHMCGIKNDNDVTVLSLKTIALEQERLVRF